MKSVVLPPEFKDYTFAVMCMLFKLHDKSLPCYVTIDEKTIEDDTHRRGGIHVDFNWYEGQWGGDNGWRPPGRHGHRPIVTERGGMLLTASHRGCRVYRGSYSGEIGRDGSCTGIDVSGLESEIMEPREVYYINALGIHEPLVIKEKTDRSLIRINFHPDYVYPL